VDEDVLLGGHGKLHVAASEMPEEYVEKVEEERGGGVPR